MLTPLLRTVHRLIARSPVERSGAKAQEAHTGAITLIERFGSALNLNIHLHCLVLDGVYRRDDDGAPLFQALPAPSNEQLQALCSTQSSPP